MMAIYSRDVLDIAILTPIGDVKDYDLLWALITWNGK